MRSVVLSLLFASAGTACSGLPSHPPTGDGEGDADWVSGLAQPEPPRLRSWDCPAGWNSVEHDTVTDEWGAPFAWCEPPPLPRLAVGDHTTPLGEGEQPGERPTCRPATDGTFPVLGYSTCQPLGPPCPAAGAWPDIPAELTGDRIYVRAGANGGDGSEDAPWETITQGVAAAGDGDLVIIGSGVYIEAISLAKPIRIFGSCVSGTVIRAPDRSEMSSTVEIISDGEVLVANLTITGERIGVRIWSTTEHCRLESLLIMEPLMNGVRFNEGARGGTLRDVVVVGGQADTGGLNGIGLFAGGGAQVTVQRSLIEQNRPYGVFLRDSGTYVVLEDLAVRGTQGQQLNGEEGDGLYAVGGARATVRRSLFTGNRFSGVDCGAQATALALEDVVVAETRIGSSTDIDAFGAGLTAGEGCTVVLDRGLFQRNGTAGVAVGHGARVAFEDLVVRETGEDVFGAEGYGLIAVSGAEITGSRALIDRNRTSGVLAGGVSTSIVATDVVIAATEGNPVSGLHGNGFSAAEGALATVSRIRVVGNRGVGIGVTGAGTVCHFEDATVEETYGHRYTGDGGYGLELSAGAQVSVERGLFVRSRTVAIMATAEETVVDLSEVTVRDTESRTGVGDFGTGLQVNQGATANVFRGLFADNRFIGVLAEGSGTAVSLHQVMVRNTRIQGCAIPGTVLVPCPGDEFGNGMDVVAGASMAVDGVRVWGSDFVGVQLAAGGTLAGRQLEIIDNDVGVNLQDLPGGYDFFTAVEDLVMGDNRINFDAIDMRVPEGATTLPEVELPEI